MEGQTLSQTQTGLEARIIGAITYSRESYDQIKNLLGNGFTEPFSPLAKICAELLEDFYARDGFAQACGKEILFNRVENKGLAPKHVEAVRTFISSIPESVSAPNLLYDLREQRKNRIGDQLAGLLANRARGAEVEALLRQYQELGEDCAPGDDDGSVYQAVPIGELLSSHFSRDGTIQFGWPKLNEACDGGARKGHHILIAGRPELGKTLVALDIISYYLSAGHSVLYVGNEEPMCDILLRSVIRLSGLSKADVRKNPEKAERVAVSRGYERFIGAALAPGNFRQIDRLVSKYGPDIVVLDQLRNIDVGDDHRVTALEKAAIGARNLAKKRSVLGISLTQAGDSAEGKPFIGMSDIDSSKTGIPGAIDLGIGVGASEEFKRAGLRGISLFKNKLGGKHENFVIRINPVLQTVEEAS